MKKIREMLSFFILTQQNNPKHNNSVFHYLKLFFERHSKYIKLNSVLGNVYKNSKWSSYRIQNLKSRFAYSFSKFFLTMFFILALFLCYRQSSFLLSGLLYNTVYFTIRDYVLDYTNLMIAMLFTSIYLIKTYTVNYYIFLLTPNDETQKITTKNTNPQTAENINITFFNKNKSPFLNGALKPLANYLNSLSLLFKIKSNLYWLNLRNETICKSIFNSSIYNVYDVQGKIIILKNFKKSIIGHEFSYKKTSKNLPFRNNMDRTNKLSTVTHRFSIKKLDTSFFNSMIFENVLNSSLNILKQTRWLTRNLLLSDKFITHNNLFTEYKKMIGDSTTVSNLPGLNVWASSYMSQIPKTKTVLNVLLSRGGIFYSNGLVNNFDESKLYLFKKIYFNTLIRYSDVISSFTSYWYPNQSDNNKYVKTNINFAANSLPYNILFLDNTNFYPYEDFIKNKGNLHKNSSISNLSDYNLLSGDNLDILVNSFIPNEDELSTAYFYFNLDDENYDEEIVDFDLVFIQPKSK